MAYTTLIEPEQLRREYSAPGWVLFDCRFDLADTGRGERDFAHGHLAGACYAHLDRDLSSPITADSGRHPLPDPQGLCSWFGAVGIGVDTQVVHGYVRCGARGAITGVGNALPKEILHLVKLCERAATGDHEALRLARELDDALAVLSAYDEGPDLVLYYKQLMVLEGNDTAASRPVTALGRSAHSGKEGDLDDQPRRLQKEALQ